MTVRALLAAAIAAAALASPAAATHLCGDRDTIVTQLAAKYGETRRSSGLQPGVGIYEVFASESGSWTILLTRPGGVACVVAAGEAWGDEKASPSLDPTIQGDPA